MSRIHIAELTAPDIQQPHEHGYKHIFFVIPAEPVVGPGHHFAQRLRFFQKKHVVLQHGLGDDHEQRSGHPFAGHIPDGHGQMVFIHQIEIVKVPAYFFRRMHGGVNIKFPYIRKSGKGLRQHPLLDIPGHRQLGGDAFVFRCDFGKIRNIGF